MNVLLLGSGGRENALALKISESKLLSKLYVAPGNPGTALCAENVEIGINDFEAIKNFIIQKAISVLIVGPEEPLVKGITDFLRNDEKLNYLNIIGPSAFGAQLEGSKDFAKKFMMRHNIPTARYQSFTSGQTAEAFKFLETLKAPYVLKADGLAAGKGVLILRDIEEAKQELQEMLSGKFGKASETVVIEEFLDGIELSVFAFTNGKDYVLLPEAKDYKCIGEGNTGPNTGGMGAVSPVPFANEEFMDKVIERIVKPTISGINEEKIDYTGFVFFGLIKVGNDPYVIEYNCRMGDPETEVVIPRIYTDLLELFEASANDELNEIQLDIDKRTATTVMLVSGGYPGDYQKGIAIQGVEHVKDSIVFHAGTKLQGNTLVTNGGRVMALTSVAEDMDKALALSYKSAEAISYEGMYFRHDIGFDLK
jgi:phosphoribosylamine--glycine ligase